MPNAAPISEDFSKLFSGKLWLQTIHYTDRAAHLSFLTPYHYTWPDSLDISDPNSMQNARHFYNQYHSQASKR